MESDLDREEHLPAQVRILLVDDDTEYHTRLSGALGEAGFSVDSARSAAEAEAQLGRAAYDLIILDVLLPDADGLQLLSNWTERLVQSKIILLTGYASVRSAFEALRAGAFDYVLKPVDLESLIEKIRQAAAGDVDSATRTETFWRNAQ
jgi:two-component system NtrC family response regulator